MCPRTSCTTRSRSAGDMRLIISLVEISRAAASLGAMVLSTEAATSSGIRMARSRAEVCGCVGCIVG